MQLSVGRQALAWTLTLIVAPPVFVVLLFATTIAAEALNDWTHFRAWIDVQAFLHSLDEIAFFTAIAALIAAPPALILGVPAAITLRRLNMKSIAAYILAGLVLGAIGGALITAAIIHFNVMPIDIPQNAVIAMAAYGTTVAIAYRLFEHHVAQMA